MGCSEAGVPRGHARRAILADSPVGEAAAALLGGVGRGMKRDWPSSTTRSIDVVGVGLLSEAPVQLVGSVTMRSFPG